MAFKESGSSSIQPVLYPIGLIGIHWSQNQAGNTLWTDLTGYTSFNLESPVDQYMHNLGEF